jgi:serine/threonine protein kinase
MTGKTELDPTTPSSGSSSLEQAIDRFEEAWASGQPPEIDGFLRDAAAPRRELIIELVHIDLERRLKRGESARVEQYLERFPELNGDDVAVELIVAEFDFRQRGDRTVSATEFCSRFPSLQPKLTERFERLPRPPQHRAPIRLNCPHCQSPISLEANAAQTATCPDCGREIPLHQDGFSSWSPQRLPTLGRFQLLHAVGRGSFGTVYRARDTKLNRTVAVKVPRSGCLATPEDEGRFVREARSVASLRHPGIVPIFEVGQGEHFPFIVAEFVEGVTLADARTGRTFDPREAASIVAQVADALDHAHRNGVVHRDVKPSNIMIGRRAEPAGSTTRESRRTDTSGVSNRTASDPAAFIMDFGLARQSEEISVTMDGQVLGTPGYMSPEQVRGESRFVDGRSDIYSLGVVLFELLTGDLPFRGVTRMLREQVLYEEPRGLRRLNDKIPRDLETITLKCMAKEPARRYGSAAELADDLLRWLRGEPIQARPISSTERFWLWARRNPRIAALSGAVAALLLALAAGSFVFAIVVNAARHEEKLARLSADSARVAAESARDRETAERRRAQWAEREARDAEQLAEQQSKRAEDEAETAKEVAEFLTSIFVVSDPLALNGLGFRESDEKARTLTAAELLDRGAARIRTELRDRPAVRAALLDVIGSVYRSLNLFDKSEPLLVEALEIRRQLYDDDHPDVAASLFSLAWLKQDMGDYAAAESMYQSVIDTRQRQLGERHLLVAAAKFNLAWVIGERTGYEPGAPDRRAESAALFLDVLDIRREQLGGEHREVGHVLVALANVKLAQGKDNEALADVAQALQILQKSEGRHGIGSAFLMVIQAHAERRARRFDQAEAIYRELIDMARHYLGDSHSMVAMALADLAGMLREKGDRAAGETTIREAIAIGRRSFGGKHPKMVHILKEFAIELASHDQTDEAKQLFREALEIAVRWYDEDNPEVVTISNRLFGLLHQSRDYDGLEQICHEPYVRPAAAIQRHRSLAAFLRQSGDLDHAAACERHVAAAQDAAGTTVQEQPQR